MKRVVVVAIVCAGLASCEAVPGAGPLASDINSQAGKSISDVHSDVHRSNADVFEIVDVNAESARTVADFSVGMLKRRFGIGGAARNVVIGVGDQLRVTIFEAGADGLFST